MPELAAAEVGHSPSSLPSPVLAVIIVLGTVLVCHWRPVYRRIQPRPEALECEAFLTASVCALRMCVCTRINDWRKANGLSRDAGRNVGQGYVYQGSIPGTTAEQLLLKKKPRKLKKKSSAVRHKASERRMVAAPNQQGAALTVLQLVEYSCRRSDRRSSLCEPMHQILSVTLTSVFTKPVADYTHDISWWSPRLLSSCHQVRGEWSGV